jgi:hypothetical protein
VVLLAHLDPCPLLHRRVAVCSGAGDWPSVTLSGSADIPAWGFGYRAVWTSVQILTDTHALLES